MRISDLSSDLCSSDLRNVRSAAVRTRRDQHYRRAGSLLQLQSNTALQWTALADARWRCDCLIPDRTAEEPIWPGGAMEQSWHAIRAHGDFSTALAGRAQCVRGKSEEHTSELQSLM